MKRMLLVAIVGLVAVAVAGAVVFAYMLTPPPIRLTVTDGSTLGVIQGDLTNYSSVSPLIRYFNATTYANQSGHPSSTLSMQVWTETYYDPVAGAVYLYVDLTVVGGFAPGLDPRALELFVNETGPLIGLHSYAVPATTNLSFDAKPYIALYEDGTGNLSATLTNGSRSAPVYDFGFYPVPSSGGMFEVVWRPRYNHFVGFRVTVTGPFTPAVGVDVLLKIINTSGGSWA